MMQFAIAIHKDELSEYGVTVPDLPGCFSSGDTIEDAIASAEEAILCHLEGLLLDDQPVPTKRSIEIHRSNPEFSGCVWAIVDADVSRLSGRTVRVNITLSERVLAIIDDAATRLGKSRSALLTEAALLEIEKREVA